MSGGFFDDSHVETLQGAMPPSSTDYFWTQWGDALLVAFVALAVAALLLLLLRVRSPRSPQIQAAQEIPPAVGPTSRTESSEDAANFRLYLERRFRMLDALNAETAAYIHRLSGWMIAQLFVANAAGLTIGSNNAPAAAMLLFVAGLIAAMACSLAAWWQSHLVYHETFRLGDPNAYFGREHLPETSEEEHNRQNRWMVGAVGAGLASLVCFAAGAVVRVLG